MKSEREATPGAAAAETKMQDSLHLSAPQTEAKSLQPPPQYYYRKTGCPAKDADDADCICWNDMGSGPFPDAKPGDSTLAWRAALGNRTPARQEERPDAHRDVLAERQRQIEVEGWDAAHDDEHTNGGMAYAAAAYAVSSEGHTERSFFITSLWAWTGWAKSWFKPKGKRADLIRAGALILAEIERLDRAALRASSAPTTKQGD